VFFDLSFTKLLVLAVIALVVFGPDRLPGLASQAGSMLRELRRMADGAKTELQDSLGPEFSQFDIADLNPKNFVRKHLLDEMNGDAGSAGNGNGNDNGLGTLSHSTDHASLSPGESPPYDAEAT
jgi:sec-independent protein translocase protein TatB